VWENQKRERKKGPGVSLGIRPGFEVGERKRRAKSTSSGKWQRVEEKGKPRDSKGGERDYKSLFRGVEKKFLKKGKRRTAANEKCLIKKCFASVPKKAP